MPYKRKSKNRKELSALRSAAARKRWDALTPEERRAQQNTAPANKARQAARMAGKVAVFEAPANPDK